MNKRAILKELINGNPDPLQIACKGLSKPVELMTDEELYRITGTKPRDMSKLTDDELRAIVNERKG
ncbi:hypothetical protein [Runella slithyformis]|uniref:Uncharacterized protein n=1 Tax=Runella slithyformis (strain ATCC 29530 / DSM 19594 / LMG 11500 / NCIMB 11436 / LSU 4) TaxID=761193 RepID=A0A7U3ZM32_RUNSL|nr:hypothetical protein [Runella slithyformis]AEI49722.1 hypothetical protein Runsl_3354 [Runella slithyformis DSM 19594]